MINLGRMAHDPTTEQLCLQSTALNSCPNPTACNAKRLAGLCYSVVGFGVSGVGSVMRPSAGSGQRPHAILACGRFWARSHLRAGMGSGVMLCVA